MSYKIIVLDIDGTILNSQKEITDKTREAIIKAQEKGVKVVIASGRPTKGISKIAEALEIERFGGYILAFNGAKIINAKTKEIIYRNELPEGATDELYDLSKENNVNIISYEPDDTVITEQPDDKYVEIEARINGLPIKKVDNFKDAVKFPVTKCLMLGDGDYLATVEPIVKAKVGDRLNVFRSEPFFLEIMPQNIDKAYSLGVLLKELNMTREEMIACGDGFNDASMIKFAGLGVAMANAQEKVKEIADYITLSNDEDGLVHVIEKFIL